MTEALRVQPAEGARNLTNVKVHCSRCPASPHSVIEQDPAEAAFPNIRRPNNLHIQLEAQSRVLCFLRMQKFVRQMPARGKPDKGSQPNESCQGLTIVLGPVRPEVLASLAARRRCSRVS